MITISALLFYFMIATIAILAAICVGGWILVRKLCSRDVEKERFIKKWKIQTF